MAKSRIVRTESNSVFHKFIIQKSFVCINITAIPWLLLIKAYPRETVYTWRLPFMNCTQKHHRKIIVYFELRLQMWQELINAAFHTVQVELKIWSFGGLLVRFLRLQASWWKIEVLLLWKPLQFSYCQTRWNRIFIKLLKKKKALLKKTKYPTGPILCFIKMVHYL